MLTWLCALLCACAQAQVVAKMRWEGCAFIRTVGTNLKMFKPGSFRIVLAPPRMLLLLLLLLLLTLRHRTCSLVERLRLLHALLCPKWFPG